MTKTEGMLSPYRVLDLTDEKGLFCGKLMADLGADVIKVEKPGGDSSRNIGPFYHDEPNPEKSLSWFAYNTNKRSITLNITQTDGKEIFRKLIKTADFVIESFSPGHLEQLGLGYRELEKINPGIIHLSITPFGQSGPYKDYKYPDIVGWALSGYMYPLGDPDRVPVSISHYPQTYLLAGATAAGTAMMALHYRQLTGEGQYLDIAIHECAVRAAYETLTNWEMSKINKRRGETRPDAKVQLTQIWPCRDGYVMCIFWGGAAGRAWNPPLVEWLDAEGVADDFMRKFDWNTFEWSTTSQETVNHLEGIAGNYFLAHTKSELMAGAVKHRFMLFPVATNKDILESAQLAGRKFWSDISHPELGVSITYPGPLANTTEISRNFVRAPLIGEHNADIYEKELGISHDELIILKRSGVI